MTSYDSDSSEDGTSGDYTSTSTLLGYASTEPTDDAISHLGGRPTWLDSSHLPSAALTRCKVCNSLMPLLLQLNGDLPERFPGHERRIWIYGCRGKTCAQKEGSVRVIRGVRIETQTRKQEEETVPERKQAEAPTTKVGETLFGSSSTSIGVNPFSSTTSSTKTNPFSTSASQHSTLPALSSLAAKPAQTPSEPTPTSSLPETFADKLSLNLPPPQPAQPPEPFPTDPSLLPTPYPLLHLDADYETLSAPATPLPTRLPTDADPSSSSTKDEADAYESPLDTIFQTFADTLAHNPEQVLRYEYAGQPLLYSRSDAVGHRFFPDPKQKKQRAFDHAVPRCASCAEPRVFEVQLVPHAILELEKDESGLDGMEWGTIVVGVCGADCVPRDGWTAGEARGGYAEEWAGVQWEGSARDGRRE